MHWINPGDLQFHFSDDTPHLLAGASRKKYKYCIQPLIQNQQQLKNKHVFRKTRKTADRRIKCIKKEKAVKKMTASPTNFLKNSLYVKSEMHNIAILDHIFFSFNSHFPSFFTSLF